MATVVVEEVSVLGAQPTAPVGRPQPPQTAAPTGRLTQPSHAVAACHPGAWD
jgi:hypothetical protein